MALAALLAPPALHAQARREARPAALIDDRRAPALAALFGYQGLFRIAGGVVLAGDATYVMERNGTRTPVPAGAVGLSVQPDGTPALVTGGRAYRLEMPPGLVCPLAQFTARGGSIAYTKPRFMNSDLLHALLRAGLVHHRIAREFDGTPFAPLLRAADFGETERLPAAVTQHLLDEINTGNGISGQILDVRENMDALVGSFINTDLQVTYHVYLLPEAGRAEIGGVPLRYYWRAEPGETAGVFGAEIYAQDWPAGARLTDWTRPGAQASQYDVVNLFQVAAVFRQVRASGPDGFQAFVQGACASRSAVAALPP
jgi:hypothetical protein